MSLLHCRAPFTTGLPLIDAQHRQLLEGVDRLAGILASGAPGPSLDEGLAHLVQHTIKHCQTEESLMKEMAFPDRVAHADQHQILIQGMRDLQYRRAKGHPMDPAEAATLAAWLEDHIEGADRAYVEYLNGRSAN